MIYSGDEGDGGRFFGGGTDVFRYGALQAGNYKKYDEYHIWDFVKEQKEKGLIRHWGFSFSGDLRGTQQTADLRKITAAGCMTDTCGRKKNTFAQQMPGCVFSIQKMHTKR